MVLGVKNMSAVQVDLRDADLIPGLGRSPGGGHGNTLQDSCLENPTDRGAWRVAVHRVTQRRTRLKWRSVRAHSALKEVAKEVACTLSATWKYKTKSTIWHPDLELPASRTVGNKSLLFISQSSLCCFLKVSRKENKPSMILGIKCTPQLFSDLLTC